jgi:hypothetical protein
MSKSMNGSKRRKVYNIELSKAMREQSNKNKKKANKLSEDQLLDLMHFAQE